MRFVVVGVDVSIVTCRFVAAGAAGEVGGESTVSGCCVGGCTVGGDTADGGAAGAGIVGVAIHVCASI